MLLGGFFGQFKSIYEYLMCINVFRGQTLIQTHTFENTPSGDTWTRHQ